MLNFFNDYYDPYCGHGRYGPQRQSKSRRAAELRRLQELELQQRQQAEFDRRRRDSWRRRVASQQEQEREEMIRERLRNDYQQKDEQGYYLVRGKNGQVYRVPASYFTSRDQIPAQSYRHDYYTESSTRNLDDDARAPDESLFSKKKYRSFLGKKPQRRKKVTVIVEDASDSENEDEMNSPWRNRRPSPGQLMEPIDFDVSS